MTSAWEDGSPNCQICFVAEAPARNEIRMNKPLVGMSGKLFNDMLHEARLVRSDLYILNVWPFEVKKEERSGKIYSPDMDLLWGPKQHFTERGLWEARNCLKALARCKANVISPLGGVALSLLFGDSRIMKWRGSILEAGSKYLSRTDLEEDWTSIIGRKLVPTLHPTYIIRGNYNARYTVTHDLERIGQEADTPQVVLPERELLVDPQFNEVIAFQRDILSRKKPIGHDIECLNSQVSCFAYAISPKTAMSIPLLAENSRHRWTEDQETEIWLNHARIMGDPEIQKIGHNFLFDTTFQLEQNNIFTSLESIECTMCAQHIMHCDFPKGLDFVTSIRTREPYYKDDGKLWSKPWVDLDRFWRYNAMDAVVTLEAWEDMQSELDDGYWHTYRTLTMDCFPMLQYMMLRGIKVNIERLRKIKEQVGGVDGESGQIGELERHLKEEAEAPFNVQSPKQCIQYFYGRKGIKPYISRKTGQPTCDDKAMAAIYRRYKLPEARLVQEIRTLRKQYSNYLDMTFDADGYFRFAVNPRGTVTGRFSTSSTIRGTGHNVQNIPDEFRDFMEADDA